MAPRNRISRLADIISTNTHKIEQYLTLNGLPTPAFDVSAPVKLQLPNELELAREAIISATTELRELMLGPRDHLYSLDQSASSHPQAHELLWKAVS